MFICRDTRTTRIRRCVFLFLPNTGTAARYDVASSRRCNFPSPLFLCTLSLISRESKSRRSFPLGFYACALTFPALYVPRASAAHSRRNEFFSPPLPFSLLSRRATSACKLKKRRRASPRFCIRETTLFVRSCAKFSRVCSLNTTDYTAIDRRPRVLFEFTKDR